MFTQPYTLTKTNIYTRINLIEYPTHETTKQNSNSLSHSLFCLILLARHGHKWTFFFFCHIASLSHRHNAFSFSGTAGAGGSNVHELDPNTNVNSQPSDTKGIDHRPNGNEVVIMSEDDRTSSFFSQPGILAGE